MQSELRNRGCICSLSAFFLGRSVLKMSRHHESRRSLEDALLALVGPDEAGCNRQDHVLRNLLGLFWRDDGDSSVVQMLLPLIRIGLEEGLPLVVVEVLGIQLPALLRLLRGLELEDVDFLGLSHGSEHHWRTIRRTLMMAMMMIIVVEISEELSLSLIEGAAIRHAVRELLLFRVLL